MVCKCYFKNIEIKHVYFRKKKKKRKNRTKYELYNTTHNIPIKYEDSVCL